MMPLKSFKPVKLILAGLQLWDRHSGPEAGCKTPSELRNQLYNSLWQSDWNGRNDFVPEGQIYDLLTETTIRHCLRASHRHKDDALVYYIMKKAMRLFTLTILINQDDRKLADYMSFFRDNGYEDSKLMAGTNFASVDVEADQFSHFNRETMLGLGNKRLFEAFASREISEKQWKVLIPVFSTGVVSYYFHDRTILPFRKIKTESDRPMRGAFSEVFKVEIHPDHFKDPLKKKSLSTQALPAPNIQHEQSERQHPKFFAVKRLIQPPYKDFDTEESWKKEVEALKLMNGVDENGNHIIRCIGGFAHRGQYHLILEWADGGTLEDLYSSHKTPKLDRKLIRQAVTQLSGLATALCATHELQLPSGDREGGNKICHGDLNPRNLLRFAPSGDNIIGNLKIGDWGLAKLHNMAASERVVNNIYTDIKYGTSRYEPPEVHGAKIILSCRYDTWSMGVVILEMLIWLLHGYEGLGSFHRGIKAAKPIQQTCWQRVNEGNKYAIRLETSVIKWLEFLKKDPLCMGEDTSALAAVLNMVETRLLVIDIGTEDQPVQQKLHHPPEKEREEVVKPGLMPTRPMALKPNRSNVFRATSREFSQLLREITAKAEDKEEYWYHKSNRPPLPDEFRRGTTVRL